MGPEDHGLPADNFQETPAPRVAHRTSPTNIGMGLLATLAAHDLGFIDTGVLAQRIDATLTTMEGLERHEGHLLNWYDTREPGSPAAAIRVDRRQRQPGRRSHGARRGPAPRRACPTSPGAPRRSPTACASASSSTRSAGSSRSAIASRTSRARAARLLLLRPARLGGPARELPRHRARRASRDALVPPRPPGHERRRRARALSWSGTAFEYLMPLLLMRSYPGTLLDARAAWPCGARSSTRRSAACRGASPSRAYNLGDRYGNYQYKAFGVPGLGLKRGLADELVVAPYATALAAMVEPRAALRNLRRLADEGARALRLLRGDRLHARESRRPGPRRERRPRRAGRSCGAFMAHHQGMTLVALANVLLDDAMVRRFHADPRVQATELLLQERVPRAAPITQPRPVEETRVAGAGRPAGRAALPLAAHAVPARAVPLERQLHHGRHQRGRRRELLPRPRGDPPPRGRDPRPREPVHLPARRAQRRGVVGDLPADAASSPRSTR